MLAPFAFADRDLEAFTGERTVDEDHATVLPAAQPDTTGDETLGDDGDRSLMTRFGGGKVGLLRSVGGYRRRTDQPEEGASCRLLPHHDRSRSLHRC